MDKLKVFIIVLTISILILLITILILISQTKKEEENEQQILDEIYISEEEPSFEEVYDNEVETDDYFLAKNCINEYFEFLNKKSEQYLVRDENGVYGYQIDEQEFKENIYSMLDKNYIDENKITIDNILNYIQPIEEGQELTITEIKGVGNQNESVFAYKVKGIIQKTDYDRTKIGEGYYVIFVDKSNSTFSIRPSNKETYNNTSNIKIPNSIEKKYANIYINEEVTSQMIAEEYFNKYKNLMLSSPEIIYEKMTEEYRRKRFGSLEILKQYLEDVNQELKGTRAAKYLISENEKNTQYVVKDQYEKIYIFDEIGNMDATIKLDTYTLDEEKFNTTYSQSQPNKKVQMNIDKFFQMLNRHDYRTSYNCLAESFRNRNMPTQYDFEKIVKSNLFSYNKVEYVSFNEVGSNTYTYKLKVTDLEGKDEKTKNLTVIMQLNEGTDFVMSFSIE